MGYNRVYNETNDNKNTIPSCVILTTEAAMRPNVIYYTDTSILESGKIQLQFKQLELGTVVWEPSYQKLLEVLNDAISISEHIVEESVERDGLHQ